MNMEQRGKKALLQDYVDFLIFKVDFS
jgi:hypothetical protein